MYIGTQMVRFGVVGGAATATHMAVAAGVLALDVPWPVWVVNFVAFSIAFWVSFFGHRHFTFQSPGSPVRFLGAAVAGLAANNACLGAALWLTGHDLLSIALSAVAAPAAVFVISRVWVFNGQA